MCTVTLFPVGKSDFVLTSNRDEAPNRVSLAPDIYDVNGVKMMFPKDKLAGGSWIGVSAKKRVLCVLNGGFSRHSRKDKYRLSRGVVMKDLLTCGDIEKAVANYELQDIEPFTLVIVDWIENLRFFELVWDGDNKHFQQLPLVPKIWSSSTLYNDKMKRERQQWFADFITANTLTKEHVLDFHQNTQKDNTEYGVVMDRLFVKTTSITQVVKQEETVSMNFNNLQEASKSYHHFELLQ